MEHIKRIFPIGKQDQPKENEKRKKAMDDRLNFSHETANNAKERKEYRELSTEITNKCKQAKDDCLNEKYIKIVRMRIIDKAD